MKFMLKLSEYKEANGNLRFQMILRVPTLRAVADYKGDSGALPQPYIILVHQYKIINYSKK